MKKKHFLKIAICLFLTLLSLNINSQTTGDIAFVGFNTDGDKDFAVVALADISANSTIYFTDDGTTGTGSPSTLVGGEGTLIWSTGLDIIEAGTIILFTDIDNDSNTNFGSSVGSITRSGFFNISSSRDNIIAYSGSLGTPSIYIAGIQIGTPSGGVYEIGPFDGDGITLTNTGLVIGTSLILADNSASPDGAIYNGTRSNHTSYSDYYSQIENNSNWTNSISDGEELLPFSQEAFTINTTTWTGGTSSVWNLAGNWDNGIPTEDSNVIIPNTANDPIISSSLSTGNITLNANANLTITGSITNKGLTVINSGATVIASGSLSGSVNYNRTLSSGSQWYYMSSPVINQTFNNSWANNNSIASGQNLNRGVSWYDNSTLDTDTDDGGPDTATGHWRYLQSDDSNSDTFDVGEGYGLITTGASTISFTGSGLHTSSQTKAITTDVSNFNLIGNPFTAFLNLGDFFGDNDNTVITGESAYFWNGSGYDTRTLGLNSSYEIAPGQGFFVEAADGVNVTFDISDISHQGTETFQKNANTRPEVQLNISDNSISKYLKVYYIDGTTKGYDLGYDGKLFGGVSHSFAIYSDLVESDGKKYQLQSLPNSDHENMVVPIGLIANAGKEITFSAEALNLPTGLKVFLEDRQSNTFTRLDEANSNYTITLDENENGIGRFYLHTKSSALNIDDVAINTIQIFKTNSSNLRIAGLPQGKSNFKLFNIIGKQVLSTSFTTNGTKDITLPTFPKGIYIVQLETESGKLNKKITID